MVPPLQRYHGTLRLPAVHLDPFEFFTSRYHRVARGLLPSVVGVPPGARELSVPVSPSGLTMETSGSLRFLGNPGGHCPCSSTPVGSGRLSGPRVSCLTRPPPVSTTKAPGVLYFRGSITRPLTSLSTLRRMGRPTTTQDSLLAAGPALPGGIRTRRRGVPGTPYLTAWADSRKSRREQALRLMASRQARLKKLGLSALATRERSTGERRRVERNK